MGFRSERHLFDALDEQARAQCARHFYDAMDEQTRSRRSRVMAERAASAKKLRDCADAARLLRATLPWLDPPTPKHVWNDLTREVPESQVWILRCLADAMETLDSATQSSLASEWSTLQAILRSTDVHLQQAHGHCEWLRISACLANIFSPASSSTQQDSIAGGETLERVQCCFETSKKALAAAEVRGNQVCAPM